MSDSNLDESEVFKAQDVDAIHQAIKPYLKPDADFHGKILFSIVQVVDTMSGGGEDDKRVGNVF